MGKKRAATPTDLAEEVHKAKEAGRKYRARLSFGEKIERMEQLRERVKPLRDARKRVSAPK